MKKEKLNFTVGRTPVTDYKAEKKVHTAPKVLEVYIDDNTGETMYNLDNGRSTSKENYDKVWNPSKKEIKPLGHKGDYINPMHSIK